MNPSSVLDQIAQSTRLRIEKRQSMLSFAELQRRVSGFRSPQPFLQRFQSVGGTRILAEVKTKSPSHGILQASLDPVTVALDYQAAGASAVSVLTEPDYFNGSLENLARIRQKAPNLLILQKDFILSDYQIFEALFYGADAILLILSLLGEERARAFHQTAQDLGLTALVEVHDEAELLMAHRMKAPFVGVNNRDLKTLKISVDVSRRLAPLLPKNSFVISESGIEQRDQIQELENLGYQGFLIGASLMRNQDPAQALSALLGGRAS